MWGLWWTKWHLGSFSPNISISPANHHSTNFSTIIITGAGTIGLLVAAVPSGPNSTPPPIIPIKKYYSSTLKIEATLSPKHPVTFSGLHGVISKKINVFITLFMKISNRTR
jgi:hypothetical protein